MALFALICVDHPDALDRRMAARPDHLAYIDQNRSLVKVAGPLLDDDGQMRGSLLILEAETKAAIEAFAAADPYALADVFAKTEIRGFRAGVGGFA
jgi:uncharacterized protein YciI